MNSGSVTGWDIGGAHLKVALLDAGGIRGIIQSPCPLWLGLERLGTAMDEVLERFGPTPLNAVTMTGELADIFASRAEGVRRLIATAMAKMAAEMPESHVLIYAGKGGMLAPERALEQPEAVASANWRASAHLAAREVEEGLFVDMGSSTTDIVPLREGRVAATGLTDFQRLAESELVYTGMTRTPLMALAGSVLFMGKRVGVMAEHFATSADIHRLNGSLPEGADLLPAADGGGKTEGDSARRLARMVGCDVADAGMAAWRELARVFISRQEDRLLAACREVISKAGLGGEAPVIGAGSGRAVIRKLAGKLERPYRDFAELLSLGISPGVSPGILPGISPGISPGAYDREQASICAPAVAVARLGLEAFQSRNTATSSPRAWGSRLPRRPSAPHRAPLKPR